MSVEHEDLDILLLADRAPSGREIVAVTQRLTEKLLHKNATRLLGLEDS